MLPLVLLEIERPRIFRLFLADRRRSVRMVVPLTTPLQLSNLVGLFLDVLVLSSDMLDQLLPGQFIEIFRHQHIAVWSSAGRDDVG